MNLENNIPIKNRLLKLSEILRVEQRKLLIEAASYNVLPNKNLLRQIAELELNITAVDNNLAEL